MHLILRCTLNLHPVVQSTVVNMLIVFIKLSVGNTSTCWSMAIDFYSKMVSRSIWKKLQAVVSNFKTSKIEQRWNLKSFLCSYMHLGRVKKSVMPLTMKDCNYISFFFYVSGESNGSNLAIVAVFDRFSSHHCKSTVCSITCL